MVKATGKQRVLAIFVLAAAAACLAGCAGGPHYFRLPFDIQQMRRVAVLPIQNLTRDNGAGVKVRRMIVAELLAQGRTEVVEPGAVDRAMHQLRVASRYALSADEVRQLGQALGAQALITGAVSEFALTRAGGQQEAAEVSVQLFMIDTESAGVIWAASDARSGLNFWVRHFGAEPLRVSEQAERSVHSLLATLAAKPTREPFPENERLKEERLRRQQLEAAQGAREKRMTVVDDMLTAALGRQIRQRVAEIKRSRDALRILCAMDVFFDYGQVEMSGEGRQVAERLAQVVKERAANQMLEVAVFPEESEVSEEVQTRYGSLWELSAARAAALLQALERHGLEPARLKASYYGAGGVRAGSAERVEITILFPLAEERRPPEAVDLSGGV